MAIQLTPQQQAGLDTLVRFANGQTDSAVAVLEGYAGTGKTTLIGHLLAVLMEDGRFGPIAVAAPTNKAVRVLREKILSAGVSMPHAPVDPDQRNRSVGALDFASIHSFLGLKMTEREDGTQECKAARDPSLHEYALVIVDECSMIGSELFQRILIAKRDALVLFVGDPAQLPPIEPGENLSPTFAKVQLKVHLSEVVRQAADNPIIALSVVLRKAIEREQRVDAMAIAETMPPLPAKAGLVTGDHRTIIEFALYEIREGRDARVVAFTNNTVLAYNAAIHQALHGVTEYLFVPGERVIVHSQCDAIETDKAGMPSGVKVQLITSEELFVVSVERKHHPLWPQVSALKIVLEQDAGDTVAVYYPEDQGAIEREISARFAEWRQLKMLAERDANAGNYRAAQDLKEQAKHASQSAWALKRAFAPLRHAYALTAHKSQGSTFDSAIVDLSDLAKMKSAFQFNRALYVAATRASEHLAIVV